MRWSYCRWLSLVLILAGTGCTVLHPEPTPPAPSANAAVVTLLDKAGEHSAAGRLSEAGVVLERALRIEPRNPFLWQELARVRLGQGQYRQAENLAAKSNSLTAGDAALCRENWRIIGQARTKRGDLQGARAAFDKAARF